MLRSQRELQHIEKIAGVAREEVQTAVGIIGPLHADLPNRQSATQAEIKKLDVEHVSVDCHLTE